MHSIIYLFFVVISLWDWGMFSNNDENAGIKKLIQRNAKRMLPDRRRKQNTQLYDREKSPGRKSSLQVSIQSRIHRQNRREECQNTQREDCTGWEANFSAET